MLKIFADLPARNGSFDFSEGLASRVGVSANVTFVHGLKIELKKLWWVK